MAETAAGAEAGWRSVFRPGPVAAALFFVLLLGGTLVWAKQRQSLAVDWFTVDVPDLGPMAAVAVRPRFHPAAPVVFYAHARHDTLEQDGIDLRQLAAAGLTVVSFAYDPAHEDRFDRQFHALRRHASLGAGEEPGRVAWVGDDRGADWLVGYANRHPGEGPDLIVLLSANLKGAPRPPAGSEPAPPLGTAWLIVHGESDEQSPAAAARALAADLGATLHVIPETPHNLEPGRRALLRWVGEKCRAQLDPGWTGEGISSVDAWKARHPAFGWYVAPALLWLGAVAVLGGVPLLPRLPPVPVSRSARWTGYLAGALGLLVGFEAAARSWARQSRGGEGSLAVARSLVVHRDDRENFDFLVGIDRARRTWGALIDEVEVASYGRQLVPWGVEEASFRDFVLSPSIGSGLPEAEGWRRLLWEEFYPHVRRARTPASVAMIAGQHLRARVTVRDGVASGSGSRADWTRQLADPSGFERLYVAVLRSLSVPARLNEQQQAEFWDGAVWSAAPRPPVTSFAAR